MNIKIAIRSLGISVSVDNGRIDMFVKKVTDNKDFIDDLVAMNLPKNIVADIVDEVSSPIEEAIIEVVRKQEKDA